MTRKHVTHSLISRFSFGLNLRPGEIHAFFLLLLLLRSSEDPMPHRAFPAPGHQKTSLPLGSWLDFEEVGDVSSMSRFLRGGENAEKPEDGSVTGVGDGDWLGGVELKVVDGIPGWTGFESAVRPAFSFVVALC